MCRYRKRFFYRCHMSLRTFLGRPQWSELLYESLRDKKDSQFFDSIQAALKRANPKNMARLLQLIERLCDDSELFREYFFKKSVVVSFFDLLISRCNYSLEPFKPKAMELLKKWNSLYVAEYPVLGLCNEYISVTGTKVIRDVTTRNSSSWKLKPDWNEYSLEIKGILANSKKILCLNSEFKPSLQVDDIIQSASLGSSQYKVDIAFRPQLAVPISHDQRKLLGEYYKNLRDSLIPRMGKWMEWLKDYPNDKRFSEIPKLLEESEKLREVLKRVISAEGEIDEMGDFIEVPVE